MEENNTINNNCSNINVDFQNILNNLVVYHSDSYFDN